MFHKYVATICSKCFIYSSLPLEQVFSCCKLQVFYLNIVYVFHIYVASVFSECFICIRRMLLSSVLCCTCSMLFGESRVQGSDGGTTRALGNEAR
jgi:hypothetical protein